MYEYSREERLWLWLHAAAGHNVIQFEKVQMMFPDLEEAFLLARQRKAGAFARLHGAFVTRLLDVASEVYIDETIAWLEKNRVGILLRDSCSYPALLKEIDHPPPILYCKGAGIKALGGLGGYAATGKSMAQAYPEQSGSIQSHENTAGTEMELPEGGLPIAIVGTRKCTPYGAGIAEYLAEEMVKGGATVVSGLALGIDGYAARGALLAEGAPLPTIAVLGSGVDVIYPSEHAGLYHQILERGVVISEFLPGTKPARENFPIRNRVISGISRGVVVVEAAAKSGASITANHALEQNRDVFAVPGRITDEISAGPNGMIQRGEAKPVFCAADILGEYGKHATGRKPARELDISMLTMEEKGIVQALERGEMSADELCEILSLPISLVNSCLTSLQFSGIIKQLPGRVFGL